MTKVLLPPRRPGEGCDVDMLIRLYELPREAAAGHNAAPYCTIRTPLGTEHDRVVAWVAAQFGDGWASEARVALVNRPTSLLLALRDGAIAGFACYDATARGIFGPIGVVASERRRKVGAALLFAALHDMRSAGYAYAVAGHVGEPEFFRRTAGATEIARSSPGLYGDLLRG